MLYQHNPFILPKVWLIFFYLLLLILGNGACRMTLPNVDWIGFHIFILCSISFAQSRLRISKRIRELEINNRPRLGRIFVSISLSMKLVHQPVLKGLTDVSFSN